MSAERRIEIPQGTTQSDRAALRRVLGQFATGVAVISTRTDTGGLVGITVNSFASVSLDPPLVLWSLRRNAGSFAVFAGATHWAVNILAAEQRALAQHFCTAQPDRFAGIAHRLGLGGAPLLDQAIARLECSVFTTVEGGDHVIHIGHLDRFDVLEGEPLLFFGGAFGRWQPTVHDAVTAE